MKDFKEIECGGEEWIQLPKNSPVAESCELGNKPSGSMIFRQFLCQLSEKSTKRRLLRGVGYLYFIKYAPMKNNFK
jgi:hypothetical protein